MHGSMNIKKKSYSNIFVKFNSKLKNTSKAETGDVANPPKSGSYYTKLTHAQKSATE